MENLRQLHIIRGLAALYVAIGHAKVILWSGGTEYMVQFPRTEWSAFDYLWFSIDILSSSAREFVIVFFVLSGFFIAYSFQKNQWKIKDFFLNRIVRLVPPYFFSVLMSILVFLAMDHFTPTLFEVDFGRAINIRMIKSFQELNLETIVRSIFFLPNHDYVAGNFSYWSLIQEWFFYLAIPFLILRKNLSLLLSTGLFVVGIIWFSGFKDPFSRFFFQFAIFFFSGVRFFDFIQNEEWKKWLPNQMLSYTILTLSVLLTIGLGALDYSPWSVISAAFLTMIAIMVLLKYPITIKPLFNAGVFLGDISYSLYILHLPILYSLYMLLFSFTGKHIFYTRIYWLAIPIVVFVSYLAFQLVELKTLHWIKKLKQSKS